MSRSRVRVVGPGAARPGRAGVRGDHSRRPRAAVRRQHAHRRQLAAAAAARSVRRGVLVSRAQPAAGPLPRRVEGQTERAHELLRAAHQSPLQRAWRSRGAWRRPMCHTPSLAAADVQDSAQDDQDILCFCEWLTRDEIVAAMPHVRDAERAARDDARVHHVLRLRGRPRRPGRRAPRPVRDGALDGARRCHARCSSATRGSRHLAGPASQRLAAAAELARASAAHGVVVPRHARHAHAPVRVQPRGARGARAVPAGRRHGAPVRPGRSRSARRRFAIPRNASLVLELADLLPAAPARPSPERPGGGRFRRRAAWLFARLPALVQRAQPDVVAREVRPDDPGRRRLLDACPTSRTATSTASTWR